MTDTQPPGTAHFFDAKVLIPFTIVTFIWGSTWLVIRDQVSDVPASWSVAYRFLIAAAAMFLFAYVRRVPLRLGWRGTAFAACVGVMQFGLNVNLVYRAEIYLTSGLVAMLYALLLVPNSLLSWVAFREAVSRPFILGSFIAIGGIALLFLHEYRMSGVAPDQVLLGMALGIGGTLAASVANVMQGSGIARRLPMASTLAWGMLLGGLADAAVAWALHGPPVFDTRPTYLAGVLYLAIAGSVMTFPLYYRLIQQIGAGRAAYSSVLIPIIAMLLSTLFEGYRWSPLALAGAALALLGMVVAMRAKTAS
ncbi:MAG: DMT family transporter [Sphingobium phenoxybenzoativorans]